MGRSGMPRPGPNRRDRRLKRQKSQARILPSKRRHGKFSHAEKLAFISQYKRVPDPTNKRSVSKQYKILRAFPLDLLKPASKAQQKELRKRGFFTTGKGVIVDGPRDSKRRPIKARRFTVLTNGEGVKWTVNGRRDYIIGLLPSERIQFAADPVAFLKAHRNMMQERYPDFRNARDVQVRLQWGAYQATKDFSPSFFFKGGGTLEKEQRLMRQGKTDKLTGLHYVIHVSHKKRRKHGRKKK